MDDGGGGAGVVVSSSPDAAVVGSVFTMMGVGFSSGFACTKTGVDVALGLTMVGEGVFAGAGAS